VKHYHKRCTEVYFILEGSGQMELGSDTVAVEPGMVIYIEPGTPHRVTGDLRTVVFGVPALEDNDEYFDC
jgi:mannose-6-phosphate isomerase-like protein (cupin superfamily)